MKTHIYMLCKNETNNGIRNNKYAELRLILEPTYSIVVFSVISLFFFATFWTFVCDSFFSACVFSTKLNFKGFLFPFHSFARIYEKRSLVVNNLIFSRSVLYENKFRNFANIWNKLPSICEGPWDVCIDIINILFYSVFSLNVYLNPDWILGI